MAFLFSPYQVRRTTAEVLSSILVDNLVHYKASCVRPFGGSFKNCLALTISIRFSDSRGAIAIYESLQCFLSYIGVNSSDIYLEELLQSDILASLLQQMKVTILLLFGDLTACTKCIFSADTLILHTNTALAD